MALASTASAALPGKLVAKDTTTNQAFLADSRIWTTTPNGCFDTFRQAYPCRRILRPDKVWVVGSYTGEVGWEFGDASTTGVYYGWKILCSKHRRVAEITQSDRDGLAPDEMWLGQVILRLPLPISKPDWCEAEVEVSSPYGTWGDMNQYEPTWDTEKVVTSEVQIRATSRRR